MKYVCVDCKYQDICGDMERTTPCDGYVYDYDNDPESGIFEEEFCELDFSGSCGSCRKCDMWVNN